MLALRRTNFLLMMGWCIICQHLISWPNQVWWVFVDSAAVIMSRVKNAAYPPHEFLLKNICGIWWTLTACPSRVFVNGLVDSAAVAMPRLKTLQKLKKSSDGTLFSFLSSCLLLSLCYILKLLDPCYPFFCVYFLLSCLLTPLSFYLLLFLLYLTSSLLISCDLSHFTHNSILICSLPLSSTNLFLFTSIPAFFSGRTFAAHNHTHSKQKIGLKKWGYLPCFLLSSFLLFLFVSSWSKICLVLVILSFVFSVSSLVLLPFLFPLFPLILIPHLTEKYLLYMIFAWSLPCFLLDIFSLLLPSQTLSFFMLIVFPFPLPFFPSLPFPSSLMIPFLTLLFHSHLSPFPLVTSVCSFPGRSALNIVFGKILGRSAFATQPWIKLKNIKKYLGRTFKVARFIHGLKTIVE